jgi:hypothetical protein
MRAHTTSADGCSDRGTTLGAARPPEPGARQEFSCPPDRCVASCEIRGTLVSATRDSSEARARRRPRVPPGEPAHARQIGSQAVRIASRRRPYRVAPSALVSGGSARPNVDDGRIHVAEEHPSRDAASGARPAVGRPSNGNASESTGPPGGASAVAGMGPHPPASGVGRNDADACRHRTGGRVDRGRDGW